MAELAPAGKVDHFLEKATKNGIKVTTPPGDASMNNPVDVAARPTKVSSPANFMEAASKHGIKVTSEGTDKIIATTPQGVTSPMELYYTLGGTYHGPVIPGTETIPLALLGHMWTPYPSGLISQRDDDEVPHGVNGINTQDNGELSSVERPTTSFIAVDLNGSEIDLYDASPVLPANLNDSFGATNVNGSNDSITNLRVSSSSTVDTSGQDAQAGDLKGGTTMVEGAEKVVRRTYSTEYMSSLKGAAEEPGEFKNVPVADEGQ